MQPITPTQVRRILEVTDGLRIHREAVIIPLGREGEGGLVRTPGSKLQITAPEVGSFDSWLAGLADRIATIDLNGILRTDDEE